MSNKKLERILELLINEDSKKAEELLHEFMVSKARSIYEEIVAEEDFEDPDEEELGGDVTDDFTSDIEADRDEIESDELNDGEPEDEFGDDEFGDEEELPIEDRVDDLEAELEALRAEFDELMAEEAGEEAHQDSDLFADELGGDDDEEVMGDDLGGDEDYDFGTEEETTESMFEETKFYKQTAKPSNTEGADAGAKKAPFTKAPTKRVINGAEPVDFTKGSGGEYGKYNGDSAKDETITDNVKVPEKPVKKPALKPTHDDKSAVSTLTKVAEARRRK